MARYLLILVHSLITLWLLIDFLLSPDGSEQEIISFIPMLTLSIIALGLWYNKKWSYIPAAINILGATGLLVLIVFGIIVFSEFFIAKFAAAFVIFLVLELSTIIFVLKTYPLKDEFAILNTETE